MFTLQDGFLFWGPQLCIPSSPLRLSLIREVNSRGLVGHFGVAKTLQLLQGKYFWSTMRHDTDQFILQYYTCQTEKGRHANGGLYTPLLAQL